MPARLKVKKDQNFFTFGPNVSLQESTQRLLHGLPKHVHIQNTTKFFIKKTPRMKEKLVNPRFILNKVTLTG